MSALSADRKAPVDYGVQIRFIKDLNDTGGSYPDKSKGNAAAPASSKYGVAVRVQGISGQPYVVLKDGEKGDSYGVQLNSPAPGSGPTSPYNSLPRISKEPAEFVNPYTPVKNAPRSPVSPTGDEDGEIFGSPLKRPPGDGQAGTQGEEEAGAGRLGKVEISKAELKLKSAPSKSGNKKDWTAEKYNEAGLKPVNLNGTGPRKVKQAGPGFSGSLGRHSVRKLSSEPPSDPLTEAPASAEAPPVAAIDTKSLAPINKLISQFNTGTPDGSGPQTRGRPGARQRLRFDERRRSRSLDARKDAQPEVSLPPPASPTVNPYAAPLPGPWAPSAPASGSLGRSPASVAKVTALEAPKPSFASPGKFVAKDTPPAAAKKPEVSPRSQSQSAEVLSVEERPIKQSFSTISSSQSDGFLKKNTNVYETSSSLKRGDGSVPKGGLEELREQLSRCNRELQQAYDELAVERMAREKAESRVRLQEDQLAELQEELRRLAETSPRSDSLQTDVVTLQAELAEAALLRQRQEDTLRQRERELTALKGALKEEVECHDQEIEVLREQYSQDMENLRKTMEEVTQSQEQIVDEREKVNASMLTLEKELEGCRGREERWKAEMKATAQELHDTKQQLQKSLQAKDDCDGKLRDLQDSVLAMKKRTPASEDKDALEKELRRCHDDLKGARADLDKQRGELQKRSEALQALEKTRADREAELLSEISGLKEQLQTEKEKAKESVEPTGPTAVDHGPSLELQEANSRLRERLARMSRLHSSSRGSEDNEALEALEDENRSLKSQLEEAKRGATRLSKERDELSRRLEERELEREALRRGKSDLEEQKRLLDRALEKINKEMEMMMGDSRQSVSALQSQLDDFRERSRKDLLEAQRNSKDRLAELQRAQSSLKTQQEEVSRLKKELLTCSEERDGAQLERDLLNNRLKHLEEELESEKSTYSDRAREVRGLEDKIKTLEIELDEERSGAELLNDRITRSRDQVDQLRSELMQERSARHDLEMDKGALERQVKELRTRVADMEGQPRPTAGLTLLENKLHELEERLRSEEREASIQASQRRTERKLKEANATLDQERTQHVEQRDQLSLRVKALKRQLDESEVEVERLEGVRRKFLRDLEEQQELQEALRAKVTAMETEYKRKSQQSHRVTLGSSTLSSEDEDGFGDSPLPTSNC
ncbi:cingulin [Betta splendens]|uniref:Cingulin n=1 Tax=Betta splendens TaxID=158456 RepID=A0A6P7NV85_BETSP|nr:cingulin [Betta splendens]